MFLGWKIENKKIKLEIQLENLHNEKKNMLREFDLYFKKDWFIRFQPFC